MTQEFEHQNDYRPNKLVFIKLYIYIYIYNFGVSYTQDEDLKNERIF